MGLKEKLLKAKPQLTEAKLGGHKVWIRGLTANEALQLSKTFEEQDTNSADVAFEVNLWVCVRCLCNEDGDRIFADDEAKLLGQFEVGQLKDIAERCMEASVPSGDEKVQIKN